MQKTDSIPLSTLEKFTTFGDLLRFLRRRAGLTQMELATAVGYSDGQISRLEQNLRLPDIPTIEARFVPAMDLEDEPKAVARLIDLAANVRREDAPGHGLCPYKGLSYFDEADADLFVGREVLTAELTARLLSLNTAHAPVEPRFLAVVGASGSGKSSLVRAGLVPSLRWNKASADWSIHIFTPAAHPLESLAACLTQESPSVAATATLMDDLASDPRSLHLYTRRRIGSQGSSRQLLVVDQFEELFTLCRSEGERAAFIGNLLSAASEEAGPTLVVITLRADFYAYCAGYDRLREALALQQEYIGAMSDDELRRAVEEPARRGRWELEPGLVELLLHDVGHEPGALPLLSHALMETWHRRRGRTLTLGGYTSSGGVRGAIAETAETVFTDQFTPEQRNIARRIFLRLTELGEETGTGDSRRRATYSELVYKPEETLATQNVLKALADARLIITSQDSTEVAHEALIREWPTLRGWLEDNREGLRLHRHLTEAAQEWAHLQRSPDALYRGARLARAGEWAADHPDEMNALEWEFLRAAQDLAECEILEREAQRRRELEAAQLLIEAERKRAEDQARAASRLRRRSFYLAGAFGVAMLMALAAGALWKQAQTSGRLAASRELAAASISNLEVDPERSVLLALAALDKTYTLEAEDALHQAVMASRLRLSIPAHAAGAALQVAFGPDGKTLATAGPDEQVKVWDATSGELRYSLAGHAAAFSPDGSSLATIASDGTVLRWDRATGQEIPLPGRIDADASVAFSPDGARLATVTSGFLPRIWDVQTGKELVSFPGHSEYVSGAVFSPDGGQLLTSSDDGTARIWDAFTGAELHQLSGHPTWVWTAAFSPTKDRIATASGNEVLIWDGARGSKLYTLYGHTNTVYALAFSPDGTRLATGSLDRRAKVWDAATGKELFTLSGHSGAVTGLDFSPDGTQLATASDDGSLRLWDLRPGRELLTLASPEGPVGQVLFSPDGERLLGTVQGDTLLWDALSGRKLRTLADEDHAASLLALSPDGKLLATAGAGENVVLWEVSSNRALGSWPAHTGKINALAFSRDGSRLASASDDYKLRVWEVSALGNPPASAESLSRTLELNAGVMSVAFSPDGARLAAGLSDGTVKVMQSALQQAELSLRGSPGPVAAVAFSPDGRSLAAAGLDGTARVWSLATGKEQLAFTGHTGAVVGIAFSPDGRRIVTASRDGKAKIWDAGSGQELLTFSGDGSGLNQVAFSPDGTRLVTAGDAGLHVYLLKIDDLAALARSRVRRLLTAEECQKYLHGLSAACAMPQASPTPTPLPPAAQGRICQVTNTAGLNDQYFNDLIYKGLQQTAQTYGWETNVLQSASMTDFGKNMQAFSQAGCDLIVALGPQVEAIQAAAQANPGQKFMHMDFAIEPPLSNVWTQTYATDQAAFLAGYVAASVTRTGKVGIFGGVDIPQVTDFMDGFALGVAYYNQKHGVNVELIGWDVQKHVGLFAGGFCCSTEGRKMAQQLILAGVDVILPVAGKSVGWGAGAQAQEHGGVWFIGVDTDWTVTAPEFAEIVLTSIEKRYDVSVVRAAGSAAKGDFTGGTHVGSLATGDVGLSPFHHLDGLVSAQIKADLEQITAGIIAGEILTRPR
jgi:WD40 repeat protein/basic membrane lipoprotein Med (substrate-binding protein (PBP1-ABC) superfamily)